MSVAIQLRLIHNKIHRAAKISGRKFEDIKIVAVSKKVSAEKIREAYSLGVKIFAENYVQEALGKKSGLKDLGIDWHFIGHLQSNKVRDVVGEFNLIHSVDRVKIATELSRCSVQVQEILIEVNLAGEQSKGGCSVADLPELLATVQSMDRLKLRGLMFMPPLDLSEDEQRRFYVAAKALRDRHAASVGAPHSLLELSMGTSHDFGIAIEEGATMVRLGTALFGEREP